MTLGPDLDWLADDEGNLRPQVARDLQEAAPPPTPGPRAATPPRRPAPAALQPGRPLPQPPAPVVLASRSSTPPILILVGVGLMVLGFALGAWSVQRSTGSGQGLVTDPATTVAKQAAFANGVNVNVRSGPGLNFPPLLRLTPGEGVLVGAEQDGWFAVTTNIGTSGWVFGALLRGQGSAAQGAAIVTQLLTSTAGASRVVLRPGDKVFVVRNGDGQTDVILPTGRRLRVASEALTRVE